MTHVARLPSRARSHGWFIDDDGFLARMKLEDDEETDKLDFTDLCEEISTTISSAAWEDTSGPTLGTPSVTTGDGGANMAVTSTVTKTGSSKLKLTLADGSVVYQPVRWLPGDEAMVSVDYR